MKKALIKDAGIVLLALAVILTGLPGIGLLAGCVSVNRKEEMK
jgi:hypothetical protein